MRWLKHLTDAHNDPAISALTEEFGTEGYGIYWLLLEHVAVGIEKGSDAVPSRTHSVVEWAKICGCSARKLRQFAQRSTELHLISSRTTADLKQFSSRMAADRLQIDVPKLLKYRDEYTKNSASLPRARVRTEGESEGNTESEREQITALAAQAPAPAETAAPETPETPEPHAPGSALSVREFERAWDRHKNYSRAHRETKSAVFQKLASMNGEFSPDIFREHHPAWCEYWERKGWNAFGSVTFLGWIEAGMPMPPPEAEDSHDRKQRRRAER